MNKPHWIKWEYFWVEKLFVWMSVVKQNLSSCFIKAKSPNKTIPLPQTQNVSYLINTDWQYDICYCQKYDTGQENPILHWVTQEEFVCLPAFLTISVCLFICFYLLFLLVVVVLNQCLTNWMEVNRLNLNPEKIEGLLFSKRSKSKNSACPRWGSHSSWRSRGFWELYFNN